MKIGVVVESASDRYVPSPAWTATDSIDQEASLRVVRDNCQTLRSATRWAESHHSATLSQECAMGETIDWLRCVSVWLRQVQTTTAKPAGYRVNVRVDPSAPQPMRVPADILAECQGFVAESGCVADDHSTECRRSSQRRRQDRGRVQAVEIRNFAYNPVTLNVPAGTTVTWINLDSVAHTVASADGTFDSVKLSPNQSFSFRFDKSGTNA